MIPQTQKPTLRLVHITEFGDMTDITVDLTDDDIFAVGDALRLMLAGCGYARESIEQILPEETE